MCVRERERERGSHHSGVYSASEIILIAACLQIHTSNITVSVTRLCSLLGLERMVKLKTLLLTVFTLILKAEARDYGMGRFNRDKQLTMTLKALLASAESEFVARILELTRSRPTALTAALVDLQINVNHLSVSVSALNPSWLYRQLDVPCCSVHSVQFWMRLWILTM